MEDPTEACHITLLPPPDSPPLVIQLPSVSEAHARLLVTPQRRSRTASTGQNPPAKKRNTTKHRDVNAPLIPKIPPPTTPNPFLSSSPHSDLPSTPKNHHTTIVQSPTFPLSSPLHGHLGSVPVLSPLRFPFHSPHSTTFTTSPLNHPSIDPYQYFLEAVFLQICAVYQLSQNLFVVNGWDRLTQCATHNWYHLSRLKVNSDTEIVCMCPAEKQGPCFHARFIKEYQDEQFPDSAADLPVSNDQPFLISRTQELDEQNWLNVFSIPPSQNPTIRNRAIVTFLGNDMGIGTWSCHKHRGALSCPHIFQARHSFQRFIHLNENALDPEATTTDIQYPEPPTHQAGAAVTESVSYLPCPVPHWARISSDPEPPSITPLERAPDYLALRPTASSCPCKSTRTCMNPLNIINKYDCIIYGLATSWNVKVELQKCPDCKKGYIGPDCRDIALFNWNNRIFLTHQLLDDYTSSYTTSETPFSAWATVVSRRYPAGKSFLDPKVFRTAWFSYIRLIKFDGDHICPQCGTLPEALIFDGVSLAFNRKNVTSSLRPPTTIHSDSTIREHTIRVPKLQLIPDARLRKNIRDILTGPPLAGDLSTQQTSLDLNIDEFVEESCSSDDDEVRNRNVSRRETAKLKRKQALLQRFKLIPDVVTSLKDLNPGMGSLFDLIFGTNSVLNNLKPPDIYKKLFIQISAEETALQMMNHPALQSLQNFLHNPTRTTASALLLIPALYNVINYEYHSIGELHPDTLRTARWLYIRGEVVRQTLHVHTTDPPRSSIHELHSWETTGCYYGMPQIRHRPQYPALKEDKTADPGLENKGGCRKYFSRYSPKKLTGGIMVAWCSHSVSYGFHCIPLSEGRNDVFSVLYTRWQTAPRVVVYDFACALQPYCLLREPEFFQNTLFVIDAFHAPDHTKCCPSSFLTTYCDSDPRLLRLNSSAAECGNGGLGRIRKSVSYMGQDRAVIYCRVFLSIWNRQRIIQMEKKSQL